MAMRSLRRWAVQATYEVSDLVPSFGDQVGFFVGSTIAQKRSPYRVTDDDSVGPIRESRFTIQWRSACSRSDIKSSTSSMPTEIRTSPSTIP